MSDCRCCGAALPAPGLRGSDRLLGTPGAFAVSRCTACGAGLTLPEVAPEELGRLYPQGYSAHQPTSGPAAVVSALIEARSRRRVFRRPPLRALRGLGGGRAVDVGCGRGDLGSWLIRRGWRVTGVEPTPAAAAAASERGLDVRMGTLADADLAPGGYDAVTFQHSLEHVPDPVADLERARDALRGGGLVLITVPNFGGAQARRFGSRWYHLDLPRHRVHFSALGLARALGRAGFEAPALSTTTSAFGLWGSVEYALLGRRPLAGAGLAGRAEEGLASFTWPLARAFDLAGGGDLLHAVARRP